MIKLVQFPKAKSIPSLSPFCLKLETYFLLAGIPYESIHTIDYKSAPKKRLPYIIKDGKKIGDSTLIIEQLAKENPNWNIDGNLSPLEKSYSTAYQRLLEDNLMPVIFHMRWADPEGWEEFSPVIFQGAPKLIRYLIGGKMHRQAKRTSKIIGIGQHSRQEILGIAERDLSAVSEFLGNKKFFLGDRPHMIDCVVFGVVGQVTLSGLPRTVTKVAEKFPKLKAHSETMRKLFTSLRK